MIYFLATEDEKYIKIGFALLDVKQRIHNHRTYSPFEYFLVGVIEGSKSDEKDLHNRFETYRKRGEWFEFSEPIRIYINGCSFISKYKKENIDLKQYRFLDELGEMYSEGITAERIAAHQNRTIKAVRRQIERFNLSRSPKQQAQPLIKNKQ